MAEHAADRRDFFDELSQKWVSLDNFAFPGENNHFAGLDGRPVIDSREKVACPRSDNHDSADDETTGFDVAPGDSLDEFRRLFSADREEWTASRETSPETDLHQPKIVSPRDDGNGSQGISKAMRRVSDELSMDSKVLLPSRSSTATPKTDKSFIPRFVKNSDLPNAKASPMQRKLQKKPLDNSPKSSTRPPISASSLTRPKSSLSSKFLLKSGAKMGSRSEGSLHTINNGHSPQNLKNVKSKVCCHLLNIVPIVCQTFIFYVLVGSRIHREREESFKGEPSWRSELSTLCGPKSAQPLEPGDPRSRGVVQPAPHEELPQLDQPRRHQGDAEQEPGG